MDSDGGNNYRNIIIAIIGALGIILAAVIPVMITKGNNDKPNPAPTPNSSRTTPSSSPYSLTIKQPTTGSGIEIYKDVMIDVKGIDLSIDVSRQVWILVQFRNENHVYPEGPCDVDIGGISRCAHAQFGDPGETGKQLSIIAVLISVADKDKYNKYAHGFVVDRPPVTPIATSKAVTVRRT